MRFLVVGGGAREHAIGLALHRAGSELYVASSNANPGLERLARRSARLDPTDPARVTSFAKEVRAEAAVIGPEAPLAAGVADALRAAGVPSVGPDRAAAQIESSKLFCRELLDRHAVGGQPRFDAPKSVEEVDAAVTGFSGPFVVKPCGLTAGKGVWVQGADFTDPREGAAYAKSILVQGQLNKQIGAAIGTTESTVKAHRAQIMRKMRAATLAELIRMAHRLQLGSEAHG